jgi:hypothetical protein
MGVSPHSIVSTPRTAQARQLAGYFGPPTLKLINI